MEDENSLELSLGLGLACGGSSSKSKDCASDPKAAGGSKNEPVTGSLNMTDVSFNPFFNSSMDNRNHVSQQQRHDNFWKDMGEHPAAEADVPKYHELWASDSKAADAAKEKGGQSKRKMHFEDLNVLKRPEMGGEDVELRRNKSPNDLTLKSHISVNSEDGSSAENEAVAESETEASTTWLMSQRRDVVNSSETHNFNEKMFSSNSSMLMSQSTKSPNVSAHESIPSTGKFGYGISHSLSLQQPPITTMPSTVPINIPNAATAHNISGTSSPSVTRLTTTLPDDPSMSHSTKPNNLQHAFGYQSVQLPTLETGSSWMLGPKSFYTPNFDGKGTADAVPNTANPENDLMAFNGKNGKHSEDVGARSSSQTEDETDGRTSQHVEVIANEGSTIRPGVAPGLKFGGCGSYPDLPWVSATGSGPNGKTISGVTYKYSRNQIKIVCACHGSHMSPEEFIQHANSDNSDTENNIGLTSFPNGNPAASAQS